jgi:quinohemoprotein ethanol dehydrogenase
MVLAALGVGGCGQRAAVEPKAAQQLGRADLARVRAADTEPENWYTTGRTLSEEHYSPLTQIDGANVGKLGFAWQYDMRTRRGLEATPVIIDGVMFVSGSWSRVYALDARDGRELWTFDPKVPGEWARNACCDVVSRGIAVWRGRVFVGTLDGRLIALDAANGKPLWSQDTLVDRSRSYTITGAPRIAGDKVIIGNGGGEIGVRGYVSAYDVMTGQLAWRFFTVPGDPAHPYEHPELEQAARTWDPESLWEAGGGGTAWDAMAYDADLDLLYVGTGNSNPYPIGLRSPAGGDNLFLSSILAIRATTGRLAWHYQTTPGETWDYTSVQHIILADLEIGGRPRKVLMQAPKNGFFYVLDRVTGELLSAKPYVPVNWASHVDMRTGRPVPTAEGDYSRVTRWVTPGTFGGHNWQPMAFSPQTRLVYIPTIESAEHFAVDREYPGYVPRLMNNVGRGRKAERHADEHSGRELPWRGALKAWDPVTQKEAWRIDYPYPYNGGLLATAGNLVFQGTTDGFLDAYDAASGKRLARITVGTSIMAAPASYSVDGQQYIAVLAGYGGALLSEYPQGSAAREYGNDGRIVAFRLGGGPVPLPSRVDWDANLPPLPEKMSTDPAVLDRGRVAFERACSACHTRDDEPNGYPNLLRLTPEKHRLFDEIVLRGAFAARGMASFADLLSESDTHALQAYLIDEAYKARSR